MILEKKKYFCIVNLLNMKKNIKSLLLTLICVLLFVSCDYGYSIFIANRTCDTILIGYSEYGTIDSVMFFLGRDGGRYKLRLPDIMVTIDETTAQNARYTLIEPDSIADYNEFNTMSFSETQEKSGYFYIIKKENAVCNSLDEIRRKKLYDSLVVHHDNIKNNNRIEYHNN